MIRISPLTLCVLTLIAGGPARAEEGKIEKAKDAVKETAHEVADATKKAATATKNKTVELYDKAAASTQHAAEVTKEKSKEAYAATKDATIKAKDKTVEVSKAVADKAVVVSKVVAEKTKEAAEVTRDKAAAWTASKEVLAAYDAITDGRLDAAERAVMKAAKDKAAAAK